MSARNAARHQILNACNRWRMIEGSNGKPFGQRHIQLAVCMARRRRLVSAEVLEAAGYRP